MIPRSTAIALAYASAIACASSPARAPARAPAPAPADAPCANCHAAITTEWRSSFHATSFTDATFERSLSLEAPPQHAFCTRCHAPAAERAGVAAGVDCASCHGASPHDARSPKKQATCATCHEFTFDDGRADLVQKTLTEHAASIFAAVPCTQCHMPSRDGHTDHRFLSGHSPATITSALHVTAARAAENAIQVSIRVDAGHAFPTGDMFRRARLTIFAEGAHGEIVADAERTFGRTWTALQSGPSAGARTEESDTRIRGSWQERIPLDPSAPIARVRWSVVYERVVAVRGPFATIASSDVVASGDLAW